MSLSLIEAVFAEYSLHLWFGYIVQPTSFNDIINVTLISISKICKPVTCVCCVVLFSTVFCVVEYDVGFGCETQCCLKDGPATAVKWLTTNRCCHGRMLASTTP